MSAPRPHPHRPAPTRTALALLTLPLLATIGVAVIRGSRHFAWDWPVHAHHHLVAHISAATGLALVGLLLVYVPLRRGEAWAWWALAAAGVAIFGAYWLGNATVGLGLEDALVPNVAQTVFTLLYVLGLGAAWFGVRATARGAPASSGAATGRT